jgi:glycine hydroxymethyltransferase
MAGIVDLVDKVITNHSNDELLEEVGKQVHEMMHGKPLFKA